MITGHEIFIDGYFNGDPHPGNVLLLGGDKGRPKLGLIDFGQVKVMSRKDVIVLSKMMIALGDNDDAMAAELLMLAGYKTKHMNQSLMPAYAKITLSEDNKKITQGMHIQTFMEHLEALDPIIELPREFVMASRVSIMLRGLGHALGQPRCMAKSWRGFAERVLVEEKVEFETKKTKFDRGVITKKEELVD